MKPFNSFMKSTDPLAFPKRMIKKQYPSLADKEFDIREIKQACDVCKEDKIPSWEIKMDGTDVWRPIPSPSMMCTPCEDRELGRQAYEAHQRMEVRRKTSKFWKINHELIAANLSNYDVTDGPTMEALQITKEFLEDFKIGKRHSIVFRGTYGAGKSHLLKAAAEVIKDELKNDSNEPYLVGFIPMEEVLSMIKGTFGTNDPDHNEHTIIQQLIDLDFLVLDDVGSEGGEWAGKKLFEIINGRLGKATGITTNFTDWDEFAKRFSENGGKIVSRIRSNAKIFDIETTDKRINEL